MWNWPEGVLFQSPASQPAAGWDGTRPAGRPAGHYSYPDRSFLPTYTEMYCGQPAVNSPHVAVSVACQRGGGMSKSRIRTSMYTLGVKSSFHGHRIRTCRSAPTVRPFGHSTDAPGGLPPTHDTLAPPLAFCQKRHFRRWSCLMLHAHAVTKPTERRYIQKYSKQNTVFRNSLGEAWS